MTNLKLVLAPHPIFKMKAKPVTEVDDDIRKLMDDILDVMYANKGVGIAAPMVGVLKKVIAVDLQENNIKSPLLMANPELFSFSSEQQTFTEGSLCFPGIRAAVTRPKTITVKYLGYDGTPAELEASGFLASCILHEMDYLRGVIFVDYLPSTKRNILLRKMIKHKKRNNIVACYASKLQY